MSRRTILVVLVGLAVLIPTAEVIEYFDLEGWAQTFALLPAMIIATLFDREYFYGRPPDGHRR